MSDDKTIWIAGAAIVIVALFAYSAGGFTLFSSVAPTTSTYDFQYQYKPTVYDAGIGKGYTQVYPAPLHIGNEFTVCSDQLTCPQIPFGNSKLGDYIQVLRSQG